jgi:Ca-activated chloride channel family protein
VILPIQDEAVSLRPALSHTAYDQSTSAQLLFKVDFSAADKQAPNRPPLNIALVLDRSSSMAEDMKFSHAIAAARAVIENLTEHDTVSLVAFNEQSLVLSPAGRAVNKPFLFQRLAEVSPEGITDLSAGLLEGIAQISSQKAKGQVKHVLLLTDGEANSGITDPAALAKIVESARAKGIGLSTLGCGTDFNAKLLTDLAAAGGNSPPRFGRNCTGCWQSPRKMCGWRLLSKAVSSAKCMASPGTRPPCHINFPLATCARANAAS